MSQSKFFVGPSSLQHDHVVLVPMELGHAEGLYEIGKDPAIWQWLTEDHFKSVEDAKRFIANAIQLRDQGAEFPFVVLDRLTSEVIGSTRYMEISDQNRSLEIGWTWYGVKAQRTAVNTECKLVLLTYAFETLWAVRMQLKTDLRNTRSQNAIKRIGAQYEGVLRKHRILPKDGYVRDTVYFSIIDEEWPTVKADLESKLSSFK